ncbi:MAG: 2'-deoxycytidine 5'-triphosphate deaminase [Dehalococcoidia bacterium]
MAEGLTGDLFPGLRRTASTYRRGVLPFEEILNLVATDAISADRPVEDVQVQPASLDLRLGEVAYQLRASFLPGRRLRVPEAMADLQIQRVSLEGGTVLQRGAVYIIPLMESLRLPKRTLAKANPKSTTGRLDVFARLITDYGELFDRVPPGYSGPLYVEVAPKTFNVLVRPGTRLNQLRFLRGVAAQSDTSQKATAAEDLVYDASGEPALAKVRGGLWFSVDLQGAGERGIAGWKALKDAPLLDFDKVDYYDPLQFWEPVRSRTDGKLILQPDEFYILGSKERVRVPPAYAAEMVPYDPAMGEFRVHYAGFFDPGFGYGTGDLRGTRAILEVRSHEVPYALSDGQHIGRLVYERLLAVPGKLYGVGATGSSYQHQQLGLGKQFRDLE